VLSARGYLCVKLSFFQSSERLGIEIGSCWSIFFSHFAKILRLGVILANYWTFSYWSAVSISGIIGHECHCIMVSDPSISGVLMFLQFSMSSCGVCSHKSWY